jgi:hypothetical protein
VKGKKMKTPEEIFEEKFREFLQNFVDEELDKGKLLPLAIAEIVRRLATEEADALENDYPAGNLESN